MDKDLVNINDSDISKSVNLEVTKDDVIAYQVSKAEDKLKRQQKRDEE